MTNKIIDSVEALLFYLRNAKYEIKLLNDYIADYKKNNDVEIEEQPKFDMYNIVEWLDTLKEDINFFEENRR